MLKMYQQPKTYIYKMLIFCLALSILKSDAFSDEEARNHVNIIKEYHSHYSFKEIFLVIPENSIRFGNVINEILKIPQITHNIHSKDFELMTESNPNEISYHHKEELIVLLVESAESFIEISFWMKISKQRNANDYNYSPQTYGYGY